MKKVQSSWFRVQSYLFIVISFLILHSYFLIPTAYAVDSTSSADLKTKLKNLQDQIASRASQLKQTISSKLQNKAYWGKVVSKTGSTITLATRTGSKIVTVNQDTLYTYSKGKLSLNTIQVDDFIVGLGDIDETGILIARKVIKSTLVEFPDLKTHWGVVTNISDLQFNIQTNDNKEIVSFTDSKTEFKFGSAAASSSDIKLKKSVIIVGLPFKSGIKPRFVYILPYTSVNLKTSPTSSPSATPASPSGIIKKTTPTPIKKPTPTP